jgi:hypothetical protein
MSIPSILVPSGTQSVRVGATDATHPQRVVGIVRQYSASWERFERDIGEFTNDTGAVEIQIAVAAGGRYFLVDGFVEPFGDNPPSPYKVTVSVVVDGAPFAGELKVQNGSGTIGKESVRFFCPFSVSVS